MTVGRQPCQGAICSIAKKRKPEGRTKGEKSSRRMLGKEKEALVKKDGASALPGVGGWVRGGRMVNLNTETLKKGIP